MPAPAPAPAPEAQPADRPDDPAGLRRHRLRWLVLPWRLLLADGEELAVRGARRSDVDALALMYGRCSPQTTRRRVGATGNGVPAAVLRQSLATDLSLVAVAGPARAVALATLTPRGPGTGEFAVIVEDAYRGRGIGTALAANLAGAARLVGYRRLRAAAPLDVPWSGRTLRRLGLAIVRDDGPDGVVARLGPGALVALPGPGATVTVPGPGA